MKPTIRIIHHLHRTGGTLISKCVASLPNIALLSEVNPNASFMVLDPVFQASFWLRLLNDTSAEQLYEASFAEKIKAIYVLATARGETLVLRNWAYLDFFALPFTPIASNELTTTNTLNKYFEIKQIVTVRHPMDQWLSWCDYQGSAKADDFTFQEFINACCEFKNQTKNMPCIHYEDFIAKPQPVMQKICQHLELQFDPIFSKRWPYYHQITGDDNDRASGDWSIAPRPRRQSGDGLQAEALSNEKYLNLLQHYDYS